MAKIKFTTDTVLTKLREIDYLCREEKTVAQAVECVGISEDVYYRWRQKYGWMTKDEYQRIRELESENEKLKELMQLWVMSVG